MNLQQFLKHKYEFSRQKYDEMSLQIYVMKYLIHLNKIGQFPNEVQTTTILSHVGPLRASLTFYFCS